MAELANVNWLAVIVGAVAAFLAGWLWYSPRLFGVKWAEGSRVELGSANEMPAFALLTQAIALLLLATVIGITATQNMLLTAILTILAAAAFVLSGGAFTRKSGYALGVDAGYIALAGVLMILAQGLL
ncbi:MAG: DUF1761 family protein [Nitratireductor sp.]|nr:DUF1761 family protein [Nitratireductor sp.]